MNFTARLMKFSQSHPSILSAFQPPSILLFTENIQDTARLPLLPRIFYLRNRQPLQQIRLDTELNVKSNWMQAKYIQFTSVSYLLFIVINNVDYTVEIHYLELLRDQQKSSRQRIFEIAENSKLSSLKCWVNLILYLVPY